MRFRIEIAITRKDVQRLASVQIEELPQPLRIPVAFVLASIGLRSESNLGLKLISVSFFSVYESLTSGAYSFNSWALLCPELPILGWWREWDRCEKFRRAVRNWLLHNKSSIELASKLIAAANTAEQRALAFRLFENDVVDNDFLD